MFGLETIDWSTKKVVVVSKYEVKWGKTKAFSEGVINGSLKTLIESGHAAAAYASQHLYGSGADFHTYQFFSDWSDFAAYEEANIGGPMDQAGKDFWSVVEGHDDEILIFIGGYNSEAKVFGYAK